MNEKDLNWVCGFLEGEAAFTAYEYKHKRSNGQYRKDKTILLRATQTNKEVLDRLLKLTKVGSIHSKKIYSPLSKKPQFEWRVHKRSELKILLPQIRPLLSSYRQEQINKMLNALDN